MTNVKPVPRTPDIKAIPPGRAAMISRSVEGTPTRGAYEKLALGDLDWQKPMLLLGTGGAVAGGILGFIGGMGVDELLRGRTVSDPIAIGFGIGIVAGAVGGAIYSRHVYLSETANRMREGRERFHEDFPASKYKYVPVTG
jgi:hypothetical protein